MSRIVVVFSSPRKNGNSCTLGKAVMDGAMGYTTNEILVHRLNSMYSIRGCQNCDRCVDVPRCYIEDDLKVVLDDIESCDALVVCVPMYFNGPCSQFKALEDRLYSHMNADLTPRFSGKKFILIITHDSPEFNDRAAELEKHIVDVFRDNLGYNVLGTINYCCNRDINAAANDPELIEKARSFGALL